MIVVNINVVDLFIPHPPTNLQISWEIDERSGFFGHVTLNISWDDSQSSYT